MARRWLFGFLEGTQRVAGRWCHPRSPEKRGMHPVRACQRVVMQTLRSSGTPRLCHPAGVRALFGARIRWCRYAPRTGYSLAMPPASPAVPGGRETAASGGVERLRQPPTPRSQASAEKWERESPAFGKPKSCGMISLAQSKLFLSPPLPPPTERLPPLSLRDLFF